MSDGYATAMLKPAALAATVLLAVPAAADAHRPSKRAAASEARYAAESRAREDHGYVLAGRMPVIANHRVTRHARAVQVVVPLQDGAVAYCMRVSHSHRVHRLRECGRTL